MYFFGIYGGVLKVHTFHQRDSLTGEDRAISDMVAQAERTGYAGIAEAASAAIRERGLGGARIGLDDTRFAGLLGDTLSNASVVDATNLLLEIRMVKTADEIAILREAARKNQRAMEAAIAAIRDGATWYEVSNAYEIEVARQGARVFASFNGAGLRSAGAARPDARYPIQPGDQVCFDSMLKWRRYMGDAQRSVVLGEAPLRLRKAWDAYAAGIAEAYDTLRPGIATGELRDRTIRTVRDNGLPSFALAFSHGIGLDHIEVPFIAGGTLGDFPVQQNMVLNIDMELHEIGWGGLFFEESMLVTATGAERLYTLPRALIEV